MSKMGDHYITLCESIGEAVSIALVSNGYARLDMADQWDIGEDILTNLHSHDLLIASTTQSKR